MEELPKAEYRKLGKCGLRVSVPILGAMSYGDTEWMKWVLKEEDSLPLLKAAYDWGLNTWDTANSYSNGVSEEIIAAAIDEYKIPRHKLIILSKCYGPIRESNSEPSATHEELRKSKEYINQFGLSRQAIFSAVVDLIWCGNHTVDASLKRLNTPYLDLLQIHRSDEHVPIEETMEALHDIIKSGRVRYIGASSMWTYQFVMMQSIAEKHGWTKFVSMQNHYSLLYREEEREMNKYCNETGVGLIPWAPLAAGRLARPSSAMGSTARSINDREASDVDQKIIDRVEEVAKKHGWTMSQVALAWINSRVTSPIIGISSLARMREAMGVNGKKLTEEENTYLSELYQPKAIDGHY